MPTETLKALEWAIQQKDIYGEPITQSEYVDYVRLYFNEHNIEYHSFNFLDLVPYLQEMGLLN